MAQLITFLHNNLVGIVVGGVVAALLGALWKLTLRFLRFVRSYGIKQALNTAREAFLHITAYNSIKTDPVLTVTYLANHLSSLIIDAAIAVVFAIVGCSAMDEPAWLRSIVIIAFIIFSYRSLRRWLAIRAFYAVTTGRTIEEVKKSNELLKKWYGIKDKKPFFQVHPTSTTTATETIDQPTLPQATQSDQSVAMTNTEPKSEGPSQQQ